MNAPLLPGKLIRPVIDLTVSAWVKQHGDLTCFGTWFLDTDGEAPWPCMVIVPTHKSMSHSYVPCIVSLDLAWIWSEENGDPEFAMATALSFARSLGLTTDWKNVNRIASIIRDHLGDLLRIGARPDNLKKIVADVLMKAENGKERTAEVRDV
jgi:hypothetical protein